MQTLKSLVQKRKAAAITGDGEKKWISQGDKIRKQEEQQKKEAEEADRKRREAEEKKLAEFEDYLETNAKKSRRTDLDAEAGEHEGTAAAASSSSASAPGGAQQGETAEDSIDNYKDDDAPPMGVKETKDRLRAMGLPITLYAETAMMRFKRMVKASMENANDVINTGQRDIFRQLLEQGDKGDRRDEDDDDEDDDADLSPRGEQQAGQDGGGAGGDVAAAATDIGMGASASASGGLGGGEGGEGGTGGEGSGTNAGGAKGALEQAEAETRNKIDTVRKFIKRMLADWEEELRQRPEAEKQSRVGKWKQAQHRQTRLDMKPLQRLLKQREVQPDVLEHLFFMTRYCEEKQYVKAHERYIDLAIGRACWPMGVTMVGLHERAGRTKIFSSQIAHILNDETTRRYIQMFKRLMTFCQKKHPTDPSQMVKIATEDMV